MPHVYVFNIYAFYEYKTFFALVPQLKKTIHVFTLTGNIKPGTDSEEGDGETSFKGDIFENKFKQFH